MEEREEEISMNKIPISVVILAKNEEEKIERCLNSVRWADEIIVMDDESADRTGEIARKYTDRVVVKKMVIEGAHRNYAYSLARNRWVLSLDADETVSHELREELRSLFKDSIKYNVFLIPIRTYLGSYWIKYGGWYPAGKARLFKKDKFKYEETEVHPRVFYAGGKKVCGHLKKDIIHYSYRDFHDFFASLNNQTTSEARKWFNEKRKIGFLRMTKKSCTRFIKSYFFIRSFIIAPISYFICSMSITKLCFYCMPSNT